MEGEMERKSHWHPVRLQQLPIKCMYAPQTCAQARTPSDTLTHTQTHVTHTSHTRTHRDNSLHPHDLLSNARGKRSKRALEASTEGCEEEREDGGRLAGSVCEKSYSSVDRYRVRVATDTWELEGNVGTKRFNTFLNRALNVCTPRPSFNTFHAHKYN